MQETIFAELYIHYETLHKEKEDTSLHADGCAVYGESKGQVCVSIGSKQHLQTDICYEQLRLLRNCSPRKGSSFLQYYLRS